MELEDRKKVFFQIQTDNSQLLFKGPMIDSFPKRQIIYFLR